MSMLYRVQHLFREYNKSSNVTLSVNCFILNLRMLPFWFWLFGEYFLNILIVML